MQMDVLETLEVGARERAQAVVIWLHGLGADGSDFEPIVPELGLPDSVRYVFPHAPIRSVTVNGGLPTRAWYGIAALGSAIVDDQAGLEESRRLLHKLIEREVEGGVAPDRIVLAGFSQGGTVVLHTGLRYRLPLAGIMALSTYLPAAERLPAERSSANAATAVFMAHGRQDQVVPFAMGVRSRDHLRALGQPVEWHDYPIEHGVSLPEIRDIAAWLRRLFVLR